MSERDVQLAADLEARRRIREALDETLFVEAGAGTGKTSALVDRYVALVLAGHSIERLVAITFTDKAAGELRDRVRGELETALLKQPESAAVVQPALDAIDAAPISTIHAFCLMLLRSYAPEAGVDPGFEVLDDVAAARRFDERWPAFLERIVADAAALAAIDHALDLGLTPWDLRLLAHELWQQPDVAQVLAARPLAAASAAWPELASMLAGLRSLRMERAPPDDRLRRPAERLTSFVEGLAATPAAERDAVLASAVESFDLSFANGRATNWRGSPPIAAVRSILGETQTTLQRTLAALRSQALAALLPVVVRFALEDAGERRRAGRLVFADLILGARDLLRDSPEARRLVRARFDALLLDEFQDTDPLQVEIALAFAADPESGRIEPVRLFCVGDPKQSIYRFRRADMAVYASTRRALEAAGAGTPVLAVSRRSRPGVIGWVNAVFERVIGAGAEPERQPPYRPIHPFRSDGGPAVFWFGDAQQENAAQVRRREAADVAYRCQAVVRSGWQVRDRRSDEPRLMTYRDIAILIPTRLLLQPLERSLAASGVPFRVEGGSLVYGTQEVRDLINCLSAIDDPADEVAVVAALRSPAYACSDVEIARFRIEGGSFNYLSPRLADAAGPVAAALRDLRRFHETRHQTSLAALVERFLAERRLVEIGVLDQGTRNPFRRARFVIEQARSFEAGRPESLRAFVAWMEQRAGELILDHEGAGLDEDEDALRIMTVHGAKGLEFPVVILAGLGSPPSRQTPVLGVDRATGRIAVSIGALTRNARFVFGAADAIVQQERRHADAERDRLLYVATTRARDYLLVSLYHKQGTAECGAAILIAAGAREHAQPAPVTPVPQPGGLAPFGELSVELPVLTGAEFAAGREALVAAARRETYTSATALGRAVGGDKPEREDVSEPWARGRAGTSLGRAVHAGLQSLPGDADAATIDTVATAQAVAEAIPERAAEVADLLRRAFASAAAARAVRARRALREVPFALKDGPVVLEGFVDLVIEADDGLEIVDWKTDRVPREAVPVRLREYELQAGLYVLGIEAATRRRVTRVTYVFVAAGEEASPGEPAALAEAARQYLASALADA